MPEEKAWNHQIPAIGKGVSLPFFSKYDFGIK